MRSGSVRFEGRLGLQQRVLPSYRAAFLERLAAACTGGLSVFAGGPRPIESIAAAEGLQGAEWVRGKNRHWFSGPIYLCSQPGLDAWLETAGLDALVLEANPRYLSNWRARRWAHAHGVPVVAWGLGAPAVPWLWAEWRRRYLAGFDALIAYSTLGAEQYRQAGFPPERVAVAVNASRSAPTGQVVAAEGDGPLRVLFVGRLQARKRVDLLIEACAAAQTPVTLTVVGDGPVRSNLESIARHRLPGTSFLGHLEGAPLENAYRRADLLVLPGTGGLAVQEAMAHQLPVVVGEGDGSQADMVRPENGWLMRKIDVESLRGILELAASDRGRLTRMGAESLRIVCDEVNIDRMVEVFVQVLNGLKGSG